MTQTRSLSAPRVSVAMSVYNNAPYLDAAIESIRAQTFGDFEFLIVNDGSTDGSDAIIDAHAAADARIRAIHQPNAGLVAALNRLIADARAPLIARMDGDDIAEPGRFAAQVAHFDSHADVGVLGTWAIGIDADGVIRPGHFEDHPTDFAAFRRAMVGGPLICHSSVMMRTELARAAGGYHGAFAHCEDYDLWLRLSETTQLYSLAEPLVRYRYSDEQVSTRHAFAQHVGAAIAWECHVEREAGRPDPSLTWTTLPPIDSLDSLFGRPGVAAAVRARVAPKLLYSETALRGDGYALIKRFLRDGGAHAGMWRTAGRLMKLGAPGRAVGLAATLLTT